MSETYTCAMCSKTYNKGQTDLEAKAELEKYFPGFETDDCDLICDDCFNLVIGKSQEA